ncbi:hypothetical protein CBR_g26151 [Chara braunii]|uniref:DUF659 domain-containing protein n=1 Tax=Chara braunii TaxID=69332 RepID=A0A388JW44_CHABU|nr:hypothetical protein CBR_g26151 [Chara braunii]|eukprot:GBG61987.1 hypothetical protein CBR_g26151 [Chara braunii]
MMGRPLTPQARLAQVARTRSQAKASANQEPPRREPEPGRRKEVVEVEDDDDEEEEDERLRQEKDQRAEQRASKKGTRGEVEPIIRDGPPKKKKYAVRLEEGFDVEKVIDRLMEGHNDLMTLKEILASAPRLRDELKGRLSRHLVLNVHLGMILPKEAEWAESGTKMVWKCVACGTVNLVVKGSKCAAMVDTGMNIIREADAIRFGLDIDRSDCGILHGASCKAVFCGTASNVLIEVGKVKVRACFFIMPDVDHGILLGRSFLSRTETVMFNKHDGTLILLLCDPACGNYEIITCRNTGPKSIRNRPNPGSFTIEESEGERRRLWAEPEAGERVEAFFLSLLDVGKAMDLVASHEMADPDAIQTLREQVLECPEAGRLELVYRLPGGGKGPASAQTQSGTYRQQAVTSYYNDPLEHAWHLQIMRFLVESGMAFNCVKLESFKRMLTMIIPPGVPGLPTPKPPTYHMIRTSLLDELDAEVQKCVKPVLATSATYGCTIMINGWTNIRGQTLCNYLVGTTRGATYVATDVMRGKKDAAALAQAWLRRLKSLDIKLADITVFVTESASSNVSAMEVFRKDESVKHIFWIPCVAHVMDLILEDIDDIEWVETRIAQARVVTKFFKRHSHAREVLQSFSTAALLLPAETRFGTHVIMMRRLLKLQSHLMRVVIDDRWKDTVWATKKIRDDAADVIACVGCPRWWEDMTALCKLLDPIMDMLQMVNSNTRQIGKILRRYDEMIVRCLSSCASFDRGDQDAVLEVFDRRRTIFKSPAHIAAMMLDPEFRERTMPDNDEMQQGLKVALVQFGYPEGSDQHNEMLAAVDKFHTREPPFDDVAMDRAARSYTHPATFWESKEKRFPHTTVFVGRILRVWVTASPCERAWSCWSFIHSKSRNRLEVARDEKLVRCNWNLRLLDRQGMSDDAPNDRPHPYGSWVHYWQQVEEEVPTDQQLVADRGARVAVTHEELLHARERMRAVSHMGAARRLRESERRRRRGGGRGGGRRAGRGRGGRGGPDRRRSVSSRGDGDSDFDDRHPDVDDDDGSGGDDRSDGGDQPRPRSTRRDDDRGLDEGAGHCRVDGDADAGSGAVASRPANGDTIDVRGVGGEHRTASDGVRDGATDGGAGLVDGGGLRRLKRGPRERDTIASRVRRRHGGVPDIPRAAVPQFEHIPVSEDSLSDHADEERMEVIDGTGHAVSDTFSIHAAAPTGSSTTIQESESGLAPSMRHPELKGDNGVLPVMDDEGSAHSLHQLTSAVAMEGVERQQPSTQGANAVVRDPMELML